MGEIFKKYDKIDRNSYQDVVFYGISDIIGRKKLLANKMSGQLYCP